MVNPNTPNSALESGAKKTGERQNLTPLIQKSIKALLGKDDIIDPRNYPIRNKTQLIEDIRNHLKLKRDDDENWSEITDETIEKISNSKILSEVELFALPLNNARKNAITRIYKSFRGLNNEVLKPDTLSASLMKYDENELSDIYTSRANMKKFLRENHQINTEILSSKMYDFREIFDIDWLRTNSPDLYKKLEYSALQYENSGIVPSKSIIQELLTYYSNNTNKRRDILTYFGVTFTIKEALWENLISDDTPHKIAAEKFAEAWKELDDTTQEKLTTKIRSDDTILLSIDDIDTEKWEQFMSNTDNTDIFIDKIFHESTLWESKSDTSEKSTQHLHMDENGNVHTSWLENMAKRIGNKIPNISNWTKWNVLVFEDKNGDTQYFQIEKTDISLGNLVDTGVTLASLAGLTPGSIGKPKGQSNISYEELEDYLMSGVKQGNIMTDSELRALATTDKDAAIDTGWALWLKEWEKVWDMSETENESSIGYLTDAINRLDPEWMNINDGKIEAGLSFESESTPNEDGVTEKWVYTIKSVQNGFITITGSGEDETASYSEFITAIDKQWIRRIARLDPANEDADMLRALWAFGVDTDHTKLEDGDLITEVEHDEDDGHGHHKKTVQKGKYEYFKSKTDSGHIRLESIKNGIVSFWDYESNKTLDEVQKIHKSKKLSEKQQEWLYTWRRMSYGAFLGYLKKNNLAATTDNLLDPHAGHAHDPHEHFEGSFFSKLGKMYSINDIIKWISNLTHHVEHYFEKTSKLNASRVTLGLAKKLWLPADLIAQAQSEEVGSVKEIIEKLQEKLGNLNWPHGRKKALHIAHNKDARPEEVAAAMLYMAKWYGQLYAEDIAYAQWSHSFINGFLNACGFRDEASRKAMKQKAKEKFLSDMWNEWGEVTEEEMIWGFMKTMDGKYEEYPLAGTVVKAMGWPGWWERAWRIEGFDGAYEKWKRQWGDTVNAKWRVNKWLSALITHEYNSAIGFMESAAWKSPDPSIQTIPVIWALGGFSQYLGTKAIQKVKGFGDSMGHTFHAYSFLRTHKENQLFRDTFMMALSEIAPEKVDELKKNINIIQRDGHGDKQQNDKVKTAILAIANIWDKYQGQWLHDMLQGKNSWLIEQARAGNQTAKAYITHLESVHMQNGGENPPPDNDWMIQYGYDSSPVFQEAEMEWKTVLSLERTLKKIRISSHSYDMDKDRQARLWPSVLARVRETRNIKDPELRRIQYNQYRFDILKWFRDSITTKWYAESTLNDIKKKSYYKDILSMGIDPGTIVASGETEKVIRTTSAEDMTMWLWWGRGSGNHEHETVREIIKDTSDKANRKVYQQGITGPRAPYREEANVPIGGETILQSEDSD